MGLSPSTEKFFRSAPAYQQPAEKIDREKGIIHGVQIVRMGAAKGHGVHLDEEFIAEVVRLGNASGQLKSRFGHPNMSSSAIGTYLGTFQNFHEKDGAAYADLHLDEAAKKAPQGDLYEYVLALSESANQHFGNSISFSHDGEQYVKDEDGAKHRLVFEEIGPSTYKAKVEQPDGSLQDYDTDTYSEEVYVKIVHLHASDLVDDPAATDSLFSDTAFDSGLIAAQVSQFLDAHPEVWNIVEKHPEKLQPFLQRYHAYKEHSATTQTNSTMKKDFTNINAALSTEMNADENGGIYLNSEQAEALELHLSHPTKKSEELAAQVVELTATTEQQTTELETATATIAERDATIAAKDEEIAELRAKPASAHSSTEADQDFQKGEEPAETPWAAAGRKMYELGKKRSEATAES